MNVAIRKILKFLIDPRTLVGIGGVVFSIVLHEIFHAIIHWNEIQSVGLFPDRHAIVEIIFEPSIVYDLAVEEGLAYTVTMATIILTAKTVSDMGEARDKRSAQQIVLSGETGRHYSHAQNKTSRERLAFLLGIKPVARKSLTRTKNKSL